MIEKSEFVGGTTAWSGAGIWLPGNPAEVRAGLEGGSEAARPYLDAIIGDDAPVALREAYLEAGPRMIEELEADPAIGEFEWRGVPDYFADAPGALRKGRTIFPANDRARRTRRPRTARAASAVDRTVGRRGAARRWSADRR